MRKFIGKNHNRIGIALLTVLFAVETVGAQAATGVPVPVVGHVPQWAVYVGLAMICPKDVNEAIAHRIGAREGDS